MNILLHKEMYFKSSKQCSLTPFHFIIKIQNDFSTQVQQAPCQMLPGKLYITDTSHVSAIHLLHCVRNTFVTTCFYLASINL